MGIVTHGIPRDLALALRDGFGLTGFVETGTFHGETTRWAAAEFSKVLTIEASRELFEQVTPSLASVPNVESLFGDSPVHLGRVVPSLPPSLFWLDAHWSAGSTAGAKNECPLLSELAAIMPWFRKHIILIDDARYFEVPPPPPHDPIEWPSLDDIFRLTQATAQTFTAIYKDVIIIAPAIYRSRITDIVHRLA